MWRAAIHADLWDIEQEGPAAFVAHVRGSLGFNAVSVPLLTGPVHRLRARPKATPKQFHTAGGLCFQPDGTHFKATRHRPPTAEWLKSRDPLGGLAEAARDSGVTLIAELDAGLPQRADRPSPVAVKNCFGESASIACLNNPDAREAMLGVVANLVEGYGIRAFALSGLASHDPATTFAMDAFNRLGDVERCLIAQCFCESCRQQMNADGCDSDALARRTAALLETAFETGNCKYASLNDLLAGEPTLRTMFDWKRARQIDFVRTLMSRSAPEVIVKSLSNLPDPLVEPLHDADLRVRSSHPADMHSDTSLMSGLGRLKEVIDIEHVQLRFALTPDLTPDEQSLVKNVADAAEAGVHDVRIDDYGRAPAVCFEWMRKALRFAGRNA